LFADIFLTPLPVEIIFCTHKTSLSSMKRKLLFLLVICCATATAFSQDPYINNQLTAAQSANAWINGKFTSSFMQTFSGTSTNGSRHHDFFGGTATPAGTNLRWAFTLQGTETSGNIGSDFRIWSYKDDGTFLSNPFSIARASGIVSIPGSLAATVINSNNTAGSLSISGGATGSGSYRGAEIGLRGGGYSTTPGEMTFHTGLGGGGTAQPERMRINVDGLVTMGYGLLLNNATSNNISFNAVGLAEPSFTTRSIGSKVILWNAALNATTSGWDIGMETNHMWFGVASQSNAQGFKFYGGTTQIGRIDGVGNSQWEGQGRFKGWLTGTAATGPAAEIGVSGGNADLIGYDRTAGSYIPLLLIGGTSATNITPVLINNVGVGIGATSSSFYSKLSIYDPLDGKASMTFQSNVDSRFWISEGGNVLKIGATGGNVAPSTGVINITNTGNVGIGTLTPQSEFSVKGTITAQRVKVIQTGWADYVFHKSYQLPSLADVEAYVHSNQHLEGIPSAAEVAKDGVDVGEMNKKLLAKVEELTLYLIEQNKKIIALEEWKKQQEKLSIHQ
jgi:hypothetical protein